MLADNKRVEETGMRTGRMKQLFAPMLSLCLCLTVCSCKDRSIGDNNSTGGNNNAGDNSNTDQDGGVDTPDARTWENLTVLVSRHSLRDATYVPVEDAVVAFDTPGGGRTEAHTDATGRVTFTGIDWTAGQGAITASYWDHVLQSILHLDPAQLEKFANQDGELWLGLEPLNPLPIETVRIGGTATGMVDTGHTLSVDVVDTMGPTTGWSTGVNLAWSVSVMRGEPFVLQARDYEVIDSPQGPGVESIYYGVMQREHDPITQDATGVVLDFSTFGMELHSATVSMLLPTGVPNWQPMGSAPACQVCATNSNRCHGWTSYRAVFDNPLRIQADFVWVEPDYPVEVYWHCAIGEYEGELFNTYNVGSKTVIPGYPQAGGHHTLMEPPRWVTPADPEVPHPVHDPLEVMYYEDVPDPGIVLRRGTEPRWLLHGRANATTFTVPEPPTGVYVSTILGANPNVVAFGGTFDDTLGWIRHTISLPVAVEP